LRYPLKPSNFRKFVEFLAGGLRVASDQSLTKPIGLKNAFDIGRRIVGAQLVHRNSASSSIVIANASSMRRTDRGALAPNPEGHATPRLALRVSSGP
jgi:hypothetical protein